MRAALRAPSTCWRGSEQGPWDAITRTGEEVQDALFERLRSHVDEDQVVELTAIIAWENASSKFNHALGVPSQRLWRR